MDALHKALDSLPHGPEFRFLDRLTALIPGETGSAEYTVRGDEPFLSGHFPGHPLFPGVLLVEAAAQLAGTVAQCDPRLAPLPGLKLTALRHIKILGTAKPGDVIQIHAKITGRLGNLIQADITGHVNRELVISGQITLSGDKA